jgi:hypothetical protein
MQMAFLVDYGALDSSMKYETEVVAHARVKPSFRSILDLVNL